MKWTTNNSVWLRVEPHAVVATALLSVLSPLRPQHTFHHRGLLFDTPVDFVRYMPPLPHGCTICHHSAPVQAQSFAFSLLRFLHVLCPPHPQLARFVRCCCYCCCFVQPFYLKGSGHCTRRSSSASVDQRRCLRRAASGRQH